MYRKIKSKTKKVPCPAWEIEDFLQGQGGFVNGIKDKRGIRQLAHLDSYMTVFEFSQLERCLKKIKKIYDREQWQNVISYWLSNCHISPNQALLSKIAEGIIL